MHKSSILILEIDYGASINSKKLYKTPFKFPKKGKNNMEFEFIEAPPLKINFKCLLSIALFFAKN